VGESLAAIISLVGRLLTLTLIINALLSWAPIDPMHPVRRTLRDICEPIVSPFRRLLPSTGMMDFSPLVAMIAIQLIATLLANLVLQLFP
jgi:YggT family protein